MKRSTIFVATVLSLFVGQVASAQYYAPAGRPQVIGTGIYGGMAMPVSSVGQLAPVYGMRPPAPVMMVPVRTAAQPRAVAPRAAEPGPKATPAKAPANASTTAKVVKAKKQTASQATKTNAELNKATRQLTQATKQLAEMSEKIDAYNTRLASFQDEVPPPLVPGEEPEAGGIDADSLAGPVEIKKGRGGKKKSSGAGYFAYGDYIYMRARNVEVPYAVEINGVVAPGAPSAQRQAVGIVEPGYDHGWRIGLGTHIDCDASLALEYMDWSSTDSDTYTRVNGAGTVIRSLVRHPADANAAIDDVQADARLDIDMMLVDGLYRRRLAQLMGFGITAVAGVRYGSIEQDFTSTFQSNGGATVTTNVDYEGIGARVGLELEGYAPINGLWGGRFSSLIKSNFSVMGGEASARYRQVDVNNGLVADTSWEAARLVPILDIELGLAYTSCDERWRVSAAYMFSAWWNTVPVTEFIPAVQNSNFNDLGDGLTFDGFVLRTEYSF